MKKIITLVSTALLLTVSSANAFWHNNNAWGNPANVQSQYVKANGIFDYNSNDYWDPRWFSTEFTNMVNEIDEPGHDYNKDDNGIFAYNSHDMWDPRWYSTEFTNMVNEIDDEFNNNNDRSYMDFPAPTAVVAK
jgi:hypothetical protein